MERGIAGDGGSGVPWAHVLADVAAEDVAAVAGAPVFGNPAAQLNRQIRDAQARIDRVTAAKWHDGLGGTGIDAAAASAAAIGRRSVGLDIERNQQFAQKEPRPARLVDEAGILADPAQAGEARISALQ